jgi:hypothetical protein
MTRLLIMAVVVGFTFGVIGAPIFNPPPLAYFVTDAAHLSICDGATITMTVRKGLIGQAQQPVVPRFGIAAQR